MADDPLIHSLKQLSPQVPSDVKSRLLYECGIAAAELKYRRQGKRHFQVATMAILLATFVGGFIGNRFTQPIQQATVVEQQPSATQQEPSSLPSPIRSQFASRDKSMLAAAMPVDRLMELLAHQETSDPVARAAAAPLTIDTPFSTRSVVDELKKL